MIAITNEDIKKAYAVYSLLDPEQKRIASEIAAKYPYTTEHVARVLSMTGFNQEEAEKYIMRELTLVGYGIRI